MTKFKHLRAQICKDIVLSFESEHITPQMIDQMDDADLRGLVLLGLGVSSD